MAASKDATVQAWVNTGFSGVLTSHALVSAWENVGFNGTASKAATASTWQNIGFSGTPSRVGTVTTWENMGLQAAVPQMIVRQPRGWGFIPNTSQTVMVLGEAATATFTAWENAV